MPGRQDIHLVPYKAYSLLQLVATLVEEHILALVGHFTQLPEISEDPISHAVATIALVQVVARDEHFVQIFAFLKYPVLQVNAIVEDVQVLAYVPQAVQELVVAKKYPSIQELATVSLVH